MGSTADKLNKLLQTKKDIKQAIIDKGVSISDTDKFADYPDKIRSIQTSSGGSEDGSSIYTDMFMAITMNNTVYSNLFPALVYIYEDINVSNWPTSTVVDMQNMFSGSSASSITADNWDTSNVHSFYRFCASAKTPYLSFKNWDCSSAYDFAYFCYYTSADVLDFSSWTNVNKITTLNMAFQNASASTIDISSFELIQPEYGTLSVSSFLKNCKQLVNLYPPKIIDVSIDLSTDTLLSHDSLLRVLNNLSTTGEGKKLTLGATNLNKLTSDEQLIATNKGWQLA